MQSVICAFSAFLRVSFKVSVLALIVGLFVVSANIPPAHAATGINQQINFQGRLLNTQGAAVADGNYNIQFKIYQDGAGTAANNPGGTLKWTENWTNQAGKGVQVKNGYMSVQLGAINPFGTQVDWNQDTLWLSINIGNTNATCTPVTACGLDGEMLPMKRLSSTPFAMNSQMLGGMTSAEFLQIAKGVQTDVSNNTSSIYLNKTGTSGNFCSCNLAAPMPSLSILVETYHLVQTKTTRFLSLRQLLAQTAKSLAFCWLRRYWGRGGCRWHADAPGRQCSR